ncbi:hypothetical protein OE88DRAFT_1673769 [Heliocybe sulcata]|uniref:Uncharacterized protein n=1 Tax=Heliocybe sulcata TaxID=5364 RepID=A0A5C3NBD8_9AGAM|nr:hypothetical protein OE88DRAFT_1673769 [Heliocybe sulcata]
MYALPTFTSGIVPFGVTYEKIGTIQRRLAWPLHKDDTLTQSGSSTELNIYAPLTNRTSFALVAFHFFQLQSQASVEPDRTAQKL